jgi:hypothetical protein
MEWGKIWAFNRRVIDPVAPRFHVCYRFKKEIVVSCPTHAVGV